MGISMEYTELDRLENALEQVTSASQVSKVNNEEEERGDSKLKKDNNSFNADKEGTQFQKLPIAHFFTPALKKQIEEDISICEKHTQRKGSEKLYNELVAKYTVLDHSFKDDLSINGKVTLWGNEFDFRPELKAISSKLKMYLMMSKTDNYSPVITKKKVEEFVKRGEVIRTEEYHPPERGVSSPYISGPLYDVWMSEINIFNDRYLKGHPLHNSIHKAFFYRNRKPSSFDEMMGYLKALVSDDVFWEDWQIKELQRVADARYSEL